MFTEGFALRYWWPFKADCCRAHRSFCIKNRPVWLIGNNPQKKVSLSRSVGEKTTHWQSITLQECIRRELKSWPVRRPRAESWTQISYILGDDFSFSAFWENPYPIEIILLCVNEYRAGLATKLSPITAWGFGDNRRGSPSFLVPGLSCLKLLLQGTLNVRRQSWEEHSATPDSRHLTVWDQHRSQGSFLIFSNFLRPFSSSAFFCHVYLATLRSCPLI